MHAFFGIIQHALATRPKASPQPGVIVFRQLDEDETYKVQLGPRGGRLEVGDDTQAALRVFCDASQLDDWLRGRWERPVRYEGDRSLFEALATLLEPPLEPVRPPRRRDDN